jgi:hypothetical protein
MRVSQRHVEELAVNDLCLAQHAEEGAVVAVHVNQANRNILAGDYGGGGGLIIETHTEHHQGGGGPR